jgi:hypothetical protein
MRATPATHRTRETRPSATPDRFLRLKRAVSNTPLARQHEQVLANGGKRKVSPIPWDEFERGKYPEAALELAARANRALASGEYGAVTLFSRITASMILHSVPFDIVAASTRAATDELRHADYAARYASLCAGKPVTLRVERAALESKTFTLLGLDKMMVEATAIGEVLAAALLEACLDRAEDPVARVFFANLVRDEVHHARLGWYYLAWRAPAWTRGERQAVADRAGRLVMDVEPRFSRGREAPRGARKAARALGVLDTAAQLEAVRCVMKDQVVPALDALGLGASHAWRARTRVA